ncbi:MAG: hypothetical protein ACTSPV_01085 [Candidatus Hodarchaeales archaeon]
MKRKGNVWIAESSDLAVFVEKAINDLVETGEWDVERGNKALEELRIRKAVNKRLENDKTNKLPKRQG